MGKQTFKLPTGMCPNCGTLLDAATDADIGSQWSRSPNAGDFSICLHCTTILRFQNDGRLAFAEEKDFEGAPVDFVEALAEAQRMARMNLSLQGRSDQAKPKLPN